MLVADENDCDPVFTRQFYTAVMEEGNDIGADVIQVNATDDDVGNNAKLRYTLSNDVRNMFEIDESSGHIVAKISIDFEENNEVHQRYTYAT